MYTPSATEISLLRQSTGAGISACRTALVTAEGDMEKAKALLRESGLAKASKREGNEASQGEIVVYTHTSDPGIPPTCGVLLELNCETDFAAKTDQFRRLGVLLATHIVACKPESVNELLKQSYLRDESLTVGELIKVTGSQIGENIVVRRFTRYELGGS